MLKMNEIAEDEELVYLKPDEEEVYLKPEKTLTYPEYVVFFDTETDTQQIDVNKYELKFKLGSYIFYDFTMGKEICRGVFYDKNEFTNKLIEFVDEYRKILVIAHNIDFDFKVLSLFNGMTNNGYVLYKQPLLENIFILVFKENNEHLKDYAKKTIKFIDSYGILRDKLANIGLSIGQKKIEIDYNNNKKKELAIYCMNDSEILLKAFIQLMKFLRENKISFKPSISGIALSCYRNNFLKDNKISLNTSMKIREIERRGYKGGRVECFKIGNKDNVNYLDINSLYPYVASSFDLPVKYYRKDIIIDVGHLVTLLKTYYVIADLNFELFKNCIGVKREINEYSKLIFPIGKIKNEILHHSEIELVLQYGRIDKINAVYLYKKGQPLKEYMEYFYELKNKSKGSSYYLFYKYLLNSLYGKFGQRNRNVDIVKDLKFKDGYYTLLMLNMLKDKKEVDKCQQEVDNYRQEVDNCRLVILNGVGYKYLKAYTWAAFTNVALAGSIAAAGRSYLFKALAIAGLENCYYCDTDSIMANDEGYNNLKKAGYLDDKIMGKFKVEQKGIVKIFNAKWYEFNNKLKIKGVKGLYADGFVSKTKVLDDNDKTIKFSQERIERIRGAIMYNRSDRQILEIVEKKLYKEYQKGIVDKKGNVKPFVLNEY